MYGSFFNMMMDNSKPAEPTVGMGATLLLWSDRHAGTIVEVSKNGKMIKWQRDKAVAEFKGMTDSQSYSYEPDPHAQIETFTLRKNGRWVKSGYGMRQGGTLSVGHRSEYYDFSF